MESLAYILVWNPFLSPNPASHPLQNYSLVPPSLLFGCFKWYLSSSFFDTMQCGLIWWIQCPRKRWHHLEFKSAQKVLNSYILNFFSKMWFICFTKHCKNCECQSTLCRCWVSMDGKVVTSSSISNKEGYKSSDNLKKPNVQQQTCCKMLRYCVKGTPVVSI